MKIDHDWTDVRQLSLPDRRVIKKEHNRSAVMHTKDRPRVKRMSLALGLIGIVSGLWFVSQTVLAVLAGILLVLIVLAVAVALYGQNHEILF